MKLESLDPILEPALGILLLILTCLLLAVPVLAWKEARSPTFTLYKKDWSCTQSHQRPSTTFVMSGKAVIPITSYRTVCDVYTRN